MLFVAASASILFLLRKTEFVKGNAYLDRYADISPTTYTVKTRFWAWTAGLDAWNDSAKTMIVGYGPENFNYPFSFHFNPKFYRGPGSETLFDRAHNMFMEVLVTMGIIGLVSYLLIFAAAFAAIKRFREEDYVFKIGLTALLVAYMIHNSFIFDTSANFLVFFTVLGLITFLDPKSKYREIERVEKKPSSALGFLLIILLIVSSLAISKINIRPARANYATTRAVIAAWEGDLDTSLEKYREAMSYEDVSIQYEIRHRFAKYIIEQANQKGALDDQRIVDALRLGLEEVQKNVDKSPDDYLPLLYLARLHIMMGKNDQASEHNDKALEASLAALEISPTFIRTYFEVAQAYLNKGDYENAIKYFQAAYDLNPEVSISAWYLALSYIQSGQTEAGLEVIQATNLNLGTQQLLQLVDVYLKQGDFQSIVGAYEKVVEREPDNPQYRASLAVAYAKVGRIQEAIEQANKAAELDPEFKAESEAFIQSLTQPQ
jgi:tetratricopeptide (TPR) repeat protein